MLEACLNRNMPYRFVSVYFCQINDSITDLFIICYKAANFIIRNLFMKNITF